MHSALFMILVDRHQGLYRIKLCSPERGNALAVAMVNALQDAVDEAIADPNIHSLLLSSAGHHFCTGFDLSDLQNLSDQDCLDRLVAIETLLQSLWYAPLRSAALCEGRAWGAGADLLAVCDQAWLGTQATIRFPGVGFGLILGTRRLGSILGSAQAMRWLSNGYSVDQTQAIESGFGHAAPDTGAYEHLTEMLSQRPLADRQTMQQLREQLRPDFRKADMKALVDSASLGSIKRRIMAYRELTLANRSRANELSDAIRTQPGG